jgi:glycine dehydrogenase subunit 1
MAERKNKVHPYIPNSAPGVRAEMLKEIGADSIETIYQVIPDGIRLKRKLNLPAPFLSEYELKQHVSTLLSKNKTCNEFINFLGGGCWHHFIPSVCDEISSRGEFLTAYAGDTYSDHGKHQAWFEFQSLLGELIDMDVVGFPTYDWPTAVSSSALMACRLTDRKEVLVPRNLNPQTLSHMQNYCRAAATIRSIEYNRDTGLLNLEDLKKNISPQTAAVYFENPSFLGVVETHGAQISEIAHSSGALSIVGVDPISLGVLAPPSHYGADIVCGDVQPLGIHMSGGGGLCGFIASKDDPEFMKEYPTLLETIGSTEREEEYAFGWATLERTSYVKRELSKDFTGTSTGLWAITAAVYLALMGPQGLKEVGTTIMQKVQYAIQQLNRLKGIRADVFEATPFKEFVVDFGGTGKTTAEINRQLLRKGIFGGLDLAATFPELGQSALYCVTEVISKDNIDQVVDSLGEIIK